MATPPTQQNNRPIGFVLDNQGAFSSFNLTINPEDLSVSEPSRLNVQQTLGGAWADSFGPGLKTIRISGNTGWRPKNDGPDWLAAFAALKTIAFTNWHTYRADLISQGKDPNGVKLIFVDVLDGITSVVAPVDFSLRRSRSRPLLMQYNITMDVLVPDAVQSLIQIPGNEPDALTQLGLASLSDNIKSLQDFIRTAKNWLDVTIREPVTNFLKQSETILTAVETTVKSGAAVVDTLGYTARQLTQAGANLFRILGLVAGIPLRLQAQFMGIAAVFTNATCLLKNAFSSAMLNLPDYSQLYGASNCSSTSGGRGLSAFKDQNALALISKPAPVQVWITANAHDSMQALAKSDPVKIKLMPAGQQQNAAITVARQTAIYHAGVVGSGVQVSSS